MTPKTTNELRKAFLDFFASKGHHIHPGISLVPTDPSVFLTSAGVVAFRDAIEGREPAEHPRVANVQRCARTTDIENVGRYGRYCTFFEMLGNWSFGDYYKRETLAWGWEFSTRVVGLDPERIWVTIYPDDEEAYRIWTEEIGLPAERVVRLDDNFWGPIVIPGACGPDSEMYYDLGPDFEGEAPGDEGDRYLEFWNHVFTEFQEQEDGSRAPLRNKNIDTGMGLERLARIVQGVPTVYDTDVFKPLMGKVEELVGRPIEGEEVFRQRIIADHARAAAFMVMDGILPENSGRGYILRRLIRRADREGLMLGLEGPFLTAFVPVVEAMMGEAYPMLAERRDFIIQAIRQEEDRFFHLLPQGINALDAMLAEEGRDRLSGAEAFRLWSSYGFPVEMTQEILAERGLPPVDTAEYAAAEKEHAGVSKHAVEGRGPAIDPGQYPPTEFVGYDATEATAHVLAVHGNRVILDRTPFYAEAGGQVGDRGALDGLRVVNTTKAGAVFLHEVDGDPSALPETVTARVDADRRRAVMRAHTATHLLHWALHEVVGPHATQKGSLVEPDRLRFDFTNLSAVTPDQLEEIERLANERILRNDPVGWRVMPIEEAKGLGAMMLFGEKYGSNVRVVTAGDYSRELCGGTHAERTGDIGLLKIVSESSVASGTRRIEAVTGMKVWEYARERDALLARAAGLLGGPPAEVPAKVEALQGQISGLKRDMQRLRASGGAGAVDDLVGRARDVAGVKLVSAALDGADAETLKAAADRIADKIGSGVVVLGSANEGKAMFVAKVTKDLAGKAHAGNLVREVAKAAGGGGGGRPDFAQAGGKDPEKLADALSVAEAALRAQLGG